MPRLIGVLEQLPDHLWHQLMSAVDAPLRHSAPREVSLEDLPTTIGPKAATTLEKVSTFEDQLVLFETYLAAYDGVDNVILGFCMQSRFALASRGPGRWEREIAAMRRAYSGPNGLLHNLRRFGAEGRPGRHPLPLSTAEAIMEAPFQYPKELLDLAQQRLQR